MEIVQKVALIFTIIGAINWGLIGIMDFNLLTIIFGVSVFAKIIYILVGVCGLINIGILFEKI